MRSLLTTLLLAIRTCGGAAPVDTGDSSPVDTGIPDDTSVIDDSDDTGACTAEYDPEGTVPIGYMHWDPADPCGTLTGVTEEHDAAYWGAWWAYLQCSDDTNDGTAVFTDENGWCIYFGFVINGVSGWRSDPWLQPAGETCVQLPSCP
jgi:hypothetical protein